MANRRWGNSPLGGDDTIFVIGTNGALPAATQGTAYSSSVAGFFRGGVPPYTFSILTQTGSNGWTISGVNIVGTPGTAETDSIVVQAKDIYGYTATATLSILVNASAMNGPAVFSIGTPAAIPNTISGSSYSYQLVPTLGVPPYSNYSLVNYSCDLLSSTSGSGPTPGNSFTCSTSGLLQSTAAISATAQNYYFWVSFVDSTSTTYHQEFAAYNASAALKIITPSNLGYLTQGNTYTSASPLATLQAVGNTGTLTWSLLNSLGGFAYPFTTGSTGNTWSINSATGAITGTATNIGVNTIAVQVTDSGTGATATEVYNISVYQYIQSAPRPSYNPSSGTSQGITCGPGFFVLNGEVYEPNGTYYRIRGWNQDFPINAIISTPWVNLMGWNGVRSVISYGSNTLANWSTYWTAANLSPPAQHLANHRCVMVLCGNDFAGNQTTGSTILGVSASGGKCGMGTILTCWSQGYSIFSASANKIMINIANEWGSYSGSTGSSFLTAYQAQQGAISAMTTTQITLSTVSATNPFANAVQVGVAYILGANGVANQLVTITAAGGSSGAWTVTGTFPSGWTSGGTLWGGAVGVMRAIGFYGPLVIDAGGGQDHSDLTSYMAQIQASDPLQNCIGSFHLYSAGAEDFNTQANFETNVCAGFNTLRASSNVPFIIGETGIYAPDNGNNGTANGGSQTAWPTPNQIQSFEKYGFGNTPWSINTGGAITDSSNGGGAGFYNQSASASDASNLGYPSFVTARGKHTILDPIRGNIVLNVGGCTSF